MKIMLFACIFFLSGITAHAQRSNVQIGIKAGVNIADYNDEVNTLDPRTGFHGGILFHVPLKRSFAFQPEIVYSQQGAEFPSGKHQIDYVNFPFLIQYLFSRGFRLQTGPQIGALVNADFENNDGEEANIEKNFEKLDVSWSFGFGYLSASGLGVDARYNVGLKDISKGPGEVQHRVWQFGLFYQFRR